MKSRVPYILTAALLTAASLSPQTREELEHATELGDVESPTTEWLGEKYARGQVSVLVFFCDWIFYRNNMRQLVEFRRALDLDLEYVLFGIHGGPQGGVRDGPRARRLLDTRKWDVIIIWSPYHPGPHFATKLPDDVRFRVLSQVREGTGLIFMSNPGSVLRKERRAETPLATLAGGLGLGAKQRTRFSTAYRLGKGRAVRMIGSGFPVREAWGFSWENRIRNDYVLARTGRATLYAAGREPEVEFVSEPQSPLEVPWGTAKGTATEWTLNTLGEPREVTVCWRIRDLTGGVWGEGRQTLENASGRSKLKVALPDLGVGSYWIDLFVDSARGRENYGFSLVRVSAPYKITIEQTKAGVETDGKLEGEVLVGPADVQAEPPPATGVALELRDTEDRILERQTLALKLNEKVPFSFEAAPHCSMQIRVQATIAAGGRIAGSKQVAYNLLKRGHGRFNVVMWGRPGGPYGYWGTRKQWKTGVTSVTDWNENGAAANLTATPFVLSFGGGWRGTLDGKKYSLGQRNITSLRADPETKVLTRYPACWNHKEKFELMLNGMDRWWRKGADRGTFVYNLYDEGPHSGCCMDPHCLSAYRGWLKEQYHDDLGALNTEWRSSYKSWDGVRPNDNSEAEARSKGNYARWSDRQHFAEVNFCRTILAGFTRRARKFDPVAKVGFEGAGRLGLDFDELFANTGFWIPYDSGEVVEALRSLSPPGYVWSFWIGYNASARVPISQVWRMVMNGAPAVGWWMLPGQGNYHGWFAPNNMPYPARQELIDECILPLRRGLGDLLIRMNRPHDGIAIYYSVAAVHAGQVPGGGAYNSVKAAHSSFIKLLEDCGLQWVYTTKKRVLRGDLEKRGIKLLILACQQALGADEVAALTEFVRKGGTILADLRPGVFSGHCRPLEHGPADKLFGIERTGPGKPESVSGKTQAKLRGTEFPLAVGNSRADAEVRPASAVPGAQLQGVPVLLVNTEEDGQAILLNFHLSEYRADRARGRGRPARAFFRSLSQALGISPRLVRTNAAGGELLRTETTTWQSGGATIYGLYRDGGGESAAEVTFPEPVFAFDLRLGPRGKTDRVKFERLKAGYAHFVATYPYDPGRPVVEASKSAAKGGETIEFSIRMTGVPGPETGVFSFETRLIDPQGKWIDVIPWSVQGTGGRAQTHVRFAHNDPPGTWTLEVREITTGRETAVEVLKQ